MNFDDLSSTLELKRNQVNEANKLALGYPVNREHSFKIDLNLLGLKPNSMSTTYLNNIASPYYHGTYTVDNIKNIEVQLFKLLGKHLQIADGQEFGYVTSGGTEANFASLWWHRNYLMQIHNVKPVLLCSARSHYSLKKIANQLDITIIEIKANYNGLDYIHLESVLKGITDPIIFSANFGATVDGAIDDVVIIKTLLDKYVPKKYKIHGDGAIYGLLIPYLQQFKNLGSVFDIIDTLSISGHKFLGSYSISGMVLTTKTYIDDVFRNKNTKISCVQNAIDITSSGSRQGLFSLELYLLLKKALEPSSQIPTKSNLEILWNECLDNANYFYQEISKLVKPKHPLLCYNQAQLSVIVPAPVNNEEKLKLGEKYGLMPVGDSQLGIYVFPRSTRAKLDSFLADYKTLII